MKILFYGINYFPELTGIGKYTAEMAEWFRARGHGVKVISAPPYYPEWNVVDPYSSWRYRFDVANGVRIYRCPLWVPKTPSSAKRLVHLASFALSSLPVLLLQMVWRPDVIVTIAPALFCAPQAALVAKLARARSVLHIQDFEIDAAFGLGMLQGRQLQRMVLALERLLLRRFDRVSTISERMVEGLINKGVSPSQSLYFPNWVDTESIVPLDHVSDYRAQLNIPPNAIVVLYSGNMGNKQGIEVLPAVSAILADRTDIRFVYCGNGASRSVLVAACAGMANVQFLDLQPADRLNELLGLADIHLLPQRAGAADLVMPSKLTGMLASGRPVLATSDPHTQLARVVEGCGLVVPPEAPERIAEGIRILADDPQLRSSLGRAARAYAEQNLGREQVLSKFLANLEELRVELP